MTHTPRAVLDTNIVLSALVFRQGRLVPIRRVWQQRSFHPLVSTATVAELIRALNYPKFKLTAEERDELLADYLPFCTTIRMPSKPPRTPPCRDPFDVPFLQLASAGKSDFLVTGDRDLLELGETLSFAIVTADAFITALGAG